MGENAAGGFFQHAQSPELGGNEENQEIRGEFQSKRSSKTFFIRVNTLNIYTQAGTIPNTSFTVFGVIPSVTVLHIPLIMRSLYFFWPV
jgi:hypothetical protein